MNDYSRSEYLKALLNQKKTLQYNVEYYKDGNLAKTEPVKKTVQWLEPDTMVVDKESFAIFITILSSFGTSFTFL